jgi:NADPH:quinone reductase-like Zn-dependent oxidoreductase
MAMRLPAKIATSIVVLLVAAVAALAIALAHNSAPAPAPPLPPNAVPIKAVVYREYGGPAVLKLEDVAKPAPAADELLIRVYDAALNPLDFHYMRGSPYIVRLQFGMGAPKRNRIGEDFSGTVDAVGARVRKFKPGDAIFGTADGALGQYVTSTEVGLALKPANISFEQAAAVPIAGLTALQGLRDYAHVQPGQKVLVNGASGGVGTFAVQLARIFGAEVTGVCSTRNLDLVRSIGANHVIDYTREDFTRGNQRYDVIFDAVGNHSARDYDRILTPKGVAVLVGAGPSFEPWLGPLEGMIKVDLMSPFLHHRFMSFIADANRTEDLVTLGDLMRAGKLVPVIDRIYQLRDSAAAMKYLEQGHARGKVIVAIG